MTVFLSEVNAAVKSSDGLPLEQKVVNSFSSFDQGTSATSRTDDRYSLQRTTGHVMTSEAEKTEPSCKCRVGTIQTKKQLVLSCGSSKLRLPWFKRCTQGIRRPLDTMISEELAMTCGSAYKEVSVAGYELAERSVSWHPFSPVTAVAVLSGLVLVALKIKLRVQLAQPML